MSGFFVAGLEGGGALRRKTPEATVHFSAILEPEGDSERRRYLFFPRHCRLAALVVFSGTHFQGTPETRVESGCRTKGHGWPDFGSPLRWPPPGQGWRRKGGMTRVDCVA